MTASDSLPGAPGDGPSLDASAIRTVGVVGAGTMGTGIAQLCLTAGLRVVLVDTDGTALDRGVARIRSGLDRLVEKGRLDAEARGRLLAALQPATGLEPLTASADLVIEAVVEDLAVKSALFGALDAGCAPQVPLATNTSSLSVSAIAAASARPGRVLGLHFFNPAPVMPLVEVVVTDRSDPLIVTRARAFVAGLGRTALTCRDAPGFIVNRVGRPFVREGLRLLEAGQGGISTIDGALEAAGYPMGPFRLLDLIGLDVEQSILAVLHAAYGDAARFAPSPLLDALVAAGRLGRKSGAGFYRSDPGPTGERLPLELPEPWASGTGARTFRSPEACVERIELAVINEAYRAVGEGVAGPDEIDQAMRLGAGHPRGPFERAGEIGLRHVVTRLHRLHLEQQPANDQYEVAPLLWHVATV